jgi:hypothetical protein
MDPDATSGFRAAIVARARFIEDLVAERYFADRTDGLRPSNGEDLLVATT